MSELIITIRAKDKKLKRSLKMKARKHKSFNAYLLNILEKEVK